MDPYSAAIPSEGSCGCIHMHVIITFMYAPLQIAQNPTKFVEMLPSKKVFIWYCQIVTEGAYLHVHVQGKQLVHGNDTLVHQ